MQKTLGGTTLNAYKAVTSNNNYATKYCDAA